LFASCCRQSRDSATRFQREAAIGWCLILETSRKLLPSISYSPLIAQPPSTTLPLSVSSLTAVNRINRISIFPSGSPDRHRLRTNDSEPPKTQTLPSPKRPFVAMAATCETIHTGRSMTIYTRRNSNRHQAPRIRLALHDLRRASAQPAV
jgi:hypothetical protein